jgi:hypothetical protein
MKNRSRTRFAFVVSGFLLAILLVVVWLGNPSGDRSEKGRNAAKSTPDQIQTDKPAPGEGPKAKNANEAQYSVEEVLALGKTDLAAAIAYINRSYDRKTRETVLRRLMVSLANEKLEVIPILDSEFTSQLERISAIAMIADYWAARDISKLLSYADIELNAPLRNTVYERAVDSLARRGEFDQAASTLQKMPFSDKRTNAISTLGQRLAAKNPDDALKWYTTFDEAQDAGTALRSLVDGFKGEGNTDGLSKLLELVPQASRGNIQREIGALMGSEGTATLSGINDANERDRLLEGAIKTVPQAELAKISQEVLSIRDEYVRMRAVSSYVGRLFEANPQDAIKWTMATPGGARDTAVSGLVSTWYYTDSEGLSDWINTLPAGRDRDTALSALASKLKPNDKQTAIEVASKINDKRRRENLLKSLGATR